MPTRSVPVAIALVSLLCMPTMNVSADESQGNAKSASKPASVLARSGCTVPCDHLAGMTDRSVMREYQRPIGTDV